LDGELVNSSPSTLAKIPLYGDKFEELCGYYMSIGMSFHEYWDGDNTMVKYYRKADGLKLERENMLRWLQGRYVYEAILDASPTLNAFKPRNPHPYRDEPIPLTEREREQSAENADRKKMEDDREKMRSMMGIINRKFQKKGGE